MVKASGSNLPASSSSSSCTAAAAVDADADADADAAATVVLGEDGELTLLLVNAEELSESLLKFSFSC